jgi:hypothetical protein
VDQREWDRSIANFVFLILSARTAEYGTVAFVTVRPEFIATAGGADTSTEDFITSWTDSWLARPKVARPNGSRVGNTRPDVQIGSHSSAAAALV